jgi:hypothetical protein
MYGAPAPSPYAQSPYYGYPGQAPQQPQQGRDQQGGGGGGGQQQASSYKDSFYQ